MGAYTLPGAERYLVSAAARNARPPTWAERLIERADEVSIFDVLEDFFDLYLPRDGSSFKSQCPFREEHPDGGRLDKGFRTYPGSNSSMCFVEHGPMGPVRLVQNKFSIKPLAAANKILDAYGLNRRRPWRERMTEVMVEVEQRQTAPITGNPTYAVEALNLALRKEPAYISRQFDEDVLNALEIVLDRLDLVMRSGEPDAVRQWYDKATHAMTQIVRRGT